MIKKLWKNILIRVFKVYFFVISFRDSCKIPKFIWAQFYSEKELSELVSGNYPVIIRRFPYTGSHCVYWLSSRLYLSVVDGRFSGFHKIERVAGLKYEALAGFFITSSGIKDHGVHPPEIKEGPEFFHTRTETEPYGRKGLFEVLNLMFLEDISRIPTYMGGPGKIRPRIAAWRLWVGR